MRVCLISRVGVGVSSSNDLPRASTSQQPKSITVIDQGLPKDSSMRSFDINHEILGCQGLSSIYEPIFAERGRVPHNDPCVLDEKYTDEWNWAFESGRKDQQGSNDMFPYMLPYPTVSHCATVFD
jgi:hypothetical protein